MCDFYSNLYKSSNINDADIDYLQRIEMPVLSDELKKNNFFNKILLS